MEKNYSDNSHSIKNTEDLTMKQMFDISEKLIVGQSDGFWSVTNELVRFFMETINYLWSVMKKSSLSRMQKVHVFSDSVSQRSEHN